MPALLRLFAMRDQQRRFWEIGLEEPVVMGSTGQHVINPLLKRGDDLEGKIAALEDRFGLSPLKQMSLGVAVGDAHRSLEQLNARLTSPQGEDEPDDPRRLVG